MSSTFYDGKAALYGEAENPVVLEEVLAFYDDYGRGMDGMQLPYVASCFRATVVEPPRPAADEAASSHAP